MTKKEKEIIKDLAMAMTRCQILENPDARKTVIVYGANALWRLLREQYEGAEDSVNTINELIK